MNIFLVAFLMAITMIVVTTSSNDFDDFMRFNKKKYASPTEKAKRKKVFDDNLKRYAAQNKKAQQTNTNAEFGVNKFADLTLQEFRDLYLGNVPVKIESKSRSLAARSPPAARSLATCACECTTTRTTTTTTRPTTTTTRTTTRTTTTTTRPTTTTTRTTTTTTRPTTTTTRPTTTTTRTTTTTTRPTTTTTRTTTPATTTPALTNVFDWTQVAGSIGPVKDQKSCGSCWAFTAAALAESLNMRKGNSYKNFSEQQLVDCSKINSLGCDGGSFYRAMLYLIANGTMLASDYPYKAANQACSYSSSKVVFYPLDWYFTNYESEIAANLKKYGPVAVSMNGDDIQGYKKGILSSDVCTDKAINHAVVIVGYGTEGTTDYWKLRNSWGPDWGEQGHFRITRNKNTCGIASYSIIFFTK